MFLREEGGEQPEPLAQIFHSAELVETTHCKYSVWYENNRPIFLRRGRRVPRQVMWSQAKSFR
jgi:hypothetical protein